MRIAVFVVALLLCGSTLFADIDCTNVDPITEVRGIWIDAGAMPKTAQGVRQMVDAYADAHFNVLFPETICRGYTVYPSALLERDPRFAGAVDPLPVMITEAHKRGLEVHPWVWVFRVGYTKDKGGILNSHPDWAEVDRDGIDLSPNGGYWVSPANPQARDFLACLYAELTAKYDVDGLHLDYIRYETDAKKPFGYSPSARAAFQKQYGIDPVDVRPGTLDQAFWNKFRERQVNTFVQRIAVQTRRIRPRAVVSAAVGSYPPDARAELMQNWPNWVANRWVDFVAPMAYSTDDAYLGRLIFRHKEAVDSRTLLAEGLGMYIHKDVAQTSAQVGIARKAGAFGQVMFASSYCGAKQLNALRCGPYCTCAAVPFRDTRRLASALDAKAGLSKAQGLPELAAYYSGAAASLNDYATYRCTPGPYVSPTLPSVQIAQ